MLVYKASIQDGNGKYVIKQEKGQLKFHRIILHCLNLVTLHIALLCDCIELFLMGKGYGV